MSSISNAMGGKNRAGIVPAGSRITSNATPVSLMAGGSFSSLGFDDGMVAI